VPALQSAFRNVEFFGQRWSGEVFAFDERRLRVACLCDCLCGAHIGLLSLNCAYELRYNSCVEISLVTHSNMRAEDWQSIRDWLTILNWRPKDQDTRFRVWLHRLERKSSDVLHASALFRPEDAERLRRLTDAWIAADRNVRKIRLSPEDAGQLTQHIRRPMQALLTVSEDGALFPSLFADPEGAPFDVAVAYFLRIAAHDERWRLCGSCRGCKDYFLRDKANERKYCGHCRSKESRSRMKRLREATKMKLLNLTREGQKKFKQDSCRDPKNWKRLVADYVNKRLPKGDEAGTITPKSLTRWVNAGLIVDLALTAEHSLKKRTA
jgi:hypothetical protein